MFPIRGGGRFAAGHSYTFLSGYRRNGCYDYRRVARQAFSTGFRSGSRLAPRVAERCANPGPRRGGADRPAQGCRRAGSAKDRDGDLARLRSRNRGRRGNHIPAGQSRSGTPPPAPSDLPPGAPEPPSPACARRNNPIAPARCSTSVWRSPQSLPSRMPSASSAPAW
jgi:hypothetical protein